MDITRSSCIVKCIKQRCWRQYPFISIIFTLQHEKWGYKVIESILPCRYRSHDLHHNWHVDILIPWLEIYRYQPVFCNFVFSALMSLVVDETCSNHLNCLFLLQMFLCYKVMLMCFRKWFGKVLSHSCLNFGSRV